VVQERIGITLPGEELEDDRIKFDRKSNPKSFPLHFFVWLFSDAGFLLLLIKFFFFYLNYFIDE
jgi:hypothetical protein